MTAKHKVSGPVGSPFANILSDGFDADEIFSFFENKGNHDKAEDWHSSLPDVDAPGQLLSSIVRGLDSEDPLVETDPIDDSAGAKPDWSGGKGKGASGKGSITDPAPTTDTGTTTGSGTTTDPAPTTDTGTTTDPVPVPDTGTSAGGFDIDLVFQGSWTASLMAAVQSAADLIETYVTGDLPSANGIDDLRITASVTSIDGSGGYFGWGGSTSVRSNGLSSEGYLKLDTADIGTMERYSVVDDFAFHEILHAMGFGIAWQSMGLVQTINGSLRFTGANAIEAYNTEYASIAANDPLSLRGVPVEMDGGSGTAGVHWDDATFGSELMTGTLGARNQISTMTIAALEDMGYQTVYGDALILA